MTVAGSAVFGVLGLAVAVRGFYFARRNLRQGRGDTRTAWTLAIYTYVCYVLSWFFSAQNETAMNGVAFGALFCSVLWVAYVAVEPYLRHQLPQILVGWARLVAGRIRDPHVGRDVLIGVAGAAAVRPLATLLHLGSEGDSGAVTPLPHFISETVSDGVGEFFRDQFLAVALSMIYLFLFLVLFSRFRRRDAAILIIAIALAAALFPLGAADTLIPFLLPLVLLSRFGFLASVVGFYTLFLTAEIVTFDFSRWYGGYAFIATVILTALAAYGTKTSLARRRPIGARVLT
jgi:hypothetical protein